MDELEAATARVDKLHVELNALEAAFDKLSDLDAKLTSIEAAVESNTRALKTRIHKNHDKRLQLRDLRDGAIESESLQKVSRALSLELDAVFGAGNRRGLDALIASADDALRQQRWQKLRDTFEWVYRAWGLLCLNFCLVLVSVLPFMGPRLGFLGPHAGAHVSRHVRSSRQGSEDAL